MANIPGISGYVQPGTFARDRVITRGVSIPGGLRIACIMGEGLKEEVIIESAAGGGQDGSSTCSPTENGDSKYFQLAENPIISGRTKLYLNGTELYGTEDEIDSASFSSKFDYRIDIDSGCIELQGASIGDQDGKKYSASASNVGNGTIVDTTCGDYDLISLVDTDAPPERWTIRCVSVIRDSSGNPISGLSTFTVSGAVSGQIKDSSGQPILFHGTNPVMFNRTGGAIPGTNDICSDSYVVADDSVYGLGSADYDSAEDSSSTTTNRFQVDADLVSPGQVLAGDYLCITDDGYTPADGIQISSLSYSSSTGKTTIVLETDTLDSLLADVSWSVRASDIFIDNVSVAHDSDGVPTSEGYFTSRDIGKVLLICDGPAPGYYVIKSVNSSRRVRVYLLGDTTSAYPELSAGTTPGIADTGENVTFSLLETNGIIIFGIREGLATSDTSGPDITFAVGDKFFIDVKSRILKKGDRLEAKYIPEATINDIEFFESANDLFLKHGTPSLTNTLSLGAQMAFENGAPGILTLQCKPAVPRRSSVVLYEEKDSRNRGGFPACGGVSADCQIDDLSFIIPMPVSGLGVGKPDGDTGINFFIKRSGVETQIFPNKVDFYNSQFESESSQSTFISSSQYSYSYTVVNTDVQITGSGFGATITASTGYFTTLDIDFDGADVGRTIVLQSIEDDDDNAFTTTTAISDQLFGVLATKTVELEILEVINDSTVLVKSVNDDSVVTDAADVVFFVKDSSNTTDVAAKILLHRDLIASKTIKPGDGLRVTYIDEKDADFFDTNWFDAFEALEAGECQMVIPLPTQNISGIFRAAVSHCENMSTIANQKERVALIGAMSGLTTAALLGTDEVAIEDVGVLEGLQGDEASEVLDGDTEDLVNYKLSDNFNSIRAVYFYPDRIIRNVSGTNSFVNGFYIATAAAGYLSASQNVAVPLTFKELTGFSIERSRIFRKLTLDKLGGEGATVVQPITGGGKVLAGRTTSQSGFVEDEEISIVFIRDRVKKVLRDSLRSFVGTVEDANTQGVMTAKVKTIMSALVSQGLITSFKSIRVERDKVDPRQWNVYLSFTPSYPINYIFLDLEVGIV